MKTHKNKEKKNKTKKIKKRAYAYFFIPQQCAQCGGRTRDLGLIRPMLYQLS